MQPFRFMTAGESHGQALVATIDGVPAGLSLGPDDIAVDLARRQKGYGRGGRMAIERDRARILSGVRHGLTIGSPIALMVENRDWGNWQVAMSVEALSPEQAAEPVTGAEAFRRAPITVPRPGHADFAGALKYAQEDDLRNILERASARETTARVAVGAVARAILRAFGVRIASRVTRIGPVADVTTAGPVGEWADRAELSETRCLDEAAEAGMKAAIDAARTEGDTLGGVFEVVAEGLPPGLGSHTQWDRKLDGILAQAMMSIQAIKGVEIGMGFGVACAPGSQVHDEILFHDGFTRPTDSAGGLEGGITTGQPLIVRAAMKPIATLRKALRSADMRTHEPVDAHFERSDVCAVPAAAVVGEAMVAIALTQALLEKFGSDNLADARAAYDAYLSRIQPNWKPAA
ncbi:MAG TPA: chorismate synthase [Armatimonadota bacterium]|jgi:chorismate synthase